MPLNCPTNRPGDQAAGIRKVHRSLRIVDLGCRPQSITSLYAVKRQIIRYGLPGYRNPGRLRRMTAASTGVTEVPGYCTCSDPKPLSGICSKERHSRGVRCTTRMRRKASIGGPFLPCRARHGRIGIGMQLPHAPVGRRMHVFPNGRLHGPSPRLPRPHSTSPSSPNPGGRNALWRDQQPVGHPLARPCIHFRTESCRTVSRGTRSGTHAPAMTTGNHPPGMEPSPVVVKSGHIDHAGKWRWDDRPFGLRQFPYTHIDGTETVPGSADSWSC